jgi:chemotaxis protein CheZ
MKAAKEHTLEALGEVLRRKREGDVSLNDVVHIAEVTVESLKAFFETVDLSVYGELRAIANFINRMKYEVSALQPNDLKKTRIPAAGLELSAVVKSTEKATNTIMGAAEMVMGTEAKDIASYKAMVDDQMMVIFEACSFQDITGQRVAKVVETLEYIESRVSRFAEVMQTTDSDGFVNDTEKRRAERAQQNILHGPQLDGEGVNQADVDALFA